MQSWNKADLLDRVLGGQLPLAEGNQSVFGCCCEHYVARPLGFLLVTATTVKTFGCNLLCLVAELVALIGFFFGCSFLACTQCSSSSLHPPSPTTSIWTRLHLDWELAMAKPAQSPGVSSRRATLGATPSLTDDDATLFRSCVGVFHVPWGPVNLRSDAWGKSYNLLIVCVSHD